MVSRKKAAAAGKAGRAKAKAKEVAAAEEERNDRAPAPLIKPTLCTHSVHPLYKGVFSQFVRAFINSFYEAKDKDGVRMIARCLVDATNATLAMDEFAEGLNDSSKLDMAVSSFLSFGTQGILDGDYDFPHDCATFARYLEQQHIAVNLKKTQALLNIPKIDETYYADKHTLVKFFRHRIPCSCLDDKYEEVKSIPKMGFCSRVNKCSASTHSIFQIE